MSYISPGGKSSSRSVSYSSEATAGPSLHSWTVGRRLANRRWRNLSVTSGSGSSSLEDAEDSSPASRDSSWVATWASGLERTVVRKTPEVDPIVEGMRTGPGGGGISGVSLDAIF